jgi:DNA-binding MarR family transcriptional regulator
MCVRTRKCYGLSVDFHLPAPPPKVDPQSLGVRAWGALLRAHASVVPILDRDLQAAVGLPLAWYDVLLELANAPERRLQMSELGERVTLSRTRVSRLVDEMQRAGYVEKQAHPSDRRSTYAVLTPAGRKQFRLAAPVYLRGIHAHFIAQLRPSELSAIAAGLQRVARATGGPAPRS